MSYPKASSSIHLFEVEGKRFVLDVNSCIFTEIDDLAWDVLEKSTEAHSRDDIIDALSAKYEASNVSEAIDELEFMESKEFLFTKDPLASYQAHASAVSTLCLNVAQDCDLNCRYCFAKGGNYGKGKARMPSKVARRAVDFIIDHSGGLQTLTLCFFGGEPLLNFPVIQETVDYSLRRGRESGKQFRFNITTNGTNLTREIREFLARNKFSTIFSIDGPKEIQDKMRPFKDGTGSYDVVSRNLRELIDDTDKDELDFSIRATYTRKLHDISKIAMHLVDMGCHDISVEPAVFRNDEFEIRARDLPEIKDEYSRFAHLYIDEIKRGRYFSFFHFRHTIDQTSRATRYLTQCGAGSGYLAVSSDGDLYPCHRFVGNDQYLMGNVFDGISRTDIVDLFISAHVNNKEKCLRCWARYICGGGCHAYAIEFNGDILKPYDIECELMKHRVELGAHIYAELVDGYQETLKKFYQRSSQSRPYLNP
jgi:uncharacterized protein